MAIVTLQLGQCGNQMGGDFFSTMMTDLQDKGQHCSTKQNADFKAAALERFFDCSESSGPHRARAVMVDMEPKVIAQTLAEAKRSRTWSYPDKQQFCQRRGSGNNWAHGFSVHGPKVREPIMEMVQREVEKCDYFGGFLALMSLAGGTGSGLGTYMTQCLRDEYPNSFIVNQVVLPYKMGEVIVQNYNAILTLSHLYQCSDALIALDNDNLHQICTQLMGIKNVSFRDINSVISHKMASIYSPMFTELDTSSTTLVRDHIGYILQHLVPHPEYKLLSLYNIPQMSQKSLKFSVFQWQGLLKHLRQMLIANAPMEEGINWQVKTSGSFNKSLSNMLFLRGLDVQQCDVSNFQESSLYVPWVPKDSNFKTMWHPRSFRQYEKSAALLSNSQAPIHNLDQVVGKAWQMFASRAYVHQYLKHGLQEEDFVDSFASLEQVIVNYNNL